MTTSAIYIRTETGNGYGHITVTVGSIDLDDRRPAFKYVSADYKGFGNGYCFQLSCQVGSGAAMDDDKYPHQRRPYAIHMGIDTGSFTDGGTEIDRMPMLAKAAAGLRRKLDKVAADIGAPETYEDHALALFLATKPARLITRKASHWDSSDEHATATADAVRQAVRHAIADVRAKLYPSEVDAA